MANAAFRLDMRVTEKTQRATVANLRQYGRGVSRDLERITVRSGERAQAMAEHFAPVDEGYMRSKIRLVISAKRLAWQLGYNQADFSGQGLADYYLFQELGFRHWITGQFIQNAHLRPAFELERPRYLREVAQALRVNAARLARAQ